MKIRTVFEVLKNGPKTKDWLRVVLTALSIVTMAALVCVEMHWLIESFGWVHHSWENYYCFVMYRGVYAFAIVFYAILVMRQAEQTYHAYLYYQHTISERVYAADHGTTPLEVIQGIHDEPVEYLATFTEDGQKVAESTLHSQREVKHEYSDVPMCAGMTEIHNHPSWLSSGFSPRDVEHAIDYSLAASIVVSRRYVYKISLATKHCQMDPEPIKQELQVAWNEATNKYPLRWNRLIAFDILRMEEIFGRYGIKFEYWPYNLYVAMEKERLNAQKSQPAVVTCVRSEKP